MVVNELPLLELFTRLRQAGLPLGINEYQLVLKALQSGFGLSDRDALARLCCTLWVKSPEEKLLFDYHFEQVMAQDEMAFAPTPAPESDVSAIEDLQSNSVVSRLRKTSPRTRWVVGGVLVLVTGIASWWVSSTKKCPYFISTPATTVAKGEKYRYEIKVQACKATPGNKLEIKARQKHPWLKFKDNQDGTATLSGNIPEESVTYPYAQLWDLQGNQLNIFGNLNNISSIKFSPDGKRLVTISSDQINKEEYRDTARLWDFQGNQLTNLGTLSEYPYPDYLYGDRYTDRAINFSPDGKRLVTISSDQINKEEYRNTARLWDFQGNQLANLGTLNGHPYYLDSYRSIKFSPDGQRLATISGIARLWDFQGNQLKIFGNLNNISDIQFSPDGKRLVTISSEKMNQGEERQTARLWDFQGNQLKIFGNLNNISNIEFSPKGQCLVTISSDKTARLWDFQGKQLANLGTLYDQSYSNIEFSPDGQRLVTI